MLALASKDEAPVTFGLARIRGLFAQLGATVPTRGFHLAYSPGFRDSVPPARRTGGTLRQAS